MKRFQITAGSITGRDHRLNSKNNQDAFRFIQTDDRLVIVICDGCGDPTAYRSEIGSGIGSALISQTIHNLSRTIKPELEDQVLSSPLFWERVALDSLAHLRTTALLLGDSLIEVVISHFLFTALGVLITNNLAVFFSLGDGHFFINGEHKSLGPFPDNIPPYLGYRLIYPDAQTGLDLQFTVHRCIPAEDLHTFLIGSDGLDALLQNQDRSIPRHPNNLVGPINQFWTEPHFVSNPAAINQRLHLINEDYQTVDWENHQLIRRKGLLPDDTTLIVGRALSEEE